MKYYQRHSKRSNGVMVEVIKWVVEIALVLLFAFFLVRYVGARVGVVGNSMQPSISNGDTVLVDRFVYKISSPDRYDIIAFYPKGNEESHIYIKRVIGLPGETVQIIDGYVYIDGEKLEEAIDIQMTNAGVYSEPVTLEEDEYFVLGDNRNSSEDSRFTNVGNVKKEYIVGKVWFRVYPYKNIGTIKYEAETKEIESSESTEETEK